MQPGDQRPGGRSARTRAAVLAATADLLAEVGYEELTFDAVAERAGVHKTTVYRRWPTKPDLVADAARERSVQLVEVPDTRLAARRSHRARRVRSLPTSAPNVGSAMTKTLVAAAATSPSVAEVTHTFWAERLRLTGEIVDRAIARGELPPAVDANLVIESLDRRALRAPAAHRRAARWRGRRSGGGCAVAVGLAVPT